MALSRSFVAALLRMTIFVAALVPLAWLGWRFLHDQLGANPIRELEIRVGGVVVGEPLSKFQGVLTGVPTIIGKSANGVLSNAELE